MSSELKFKHLVEQYQKGLLTNKNEALMDEFLETLARRGSDVNEKEMEWSETDRLALKNRILFTIGQSNTAITWRDGKVVSLRWFQAAAAVTLLVVFSYWILRQRTDSWERETEITTTSPAIDIPAGSDKAILLLADNTVVELNDRGQQVIPKQGAVSVINAKGTLAYNQEAGASQLTYNKIITPRGGQYKVSLSDGSQVWLNAASSLRYPTSFIGTERVVELTGEAYFDITSLVQSSGEKIPFKVRIPSGAEIEVLGTQFNVMAYEEEEAIKTTLLEGAVKVSLGQSSLERTAVRLSPNQQARITKADRLSVIVEVDVAQAIAWKNNKFIFKDTGIEEIMRQLSRWYDVEVTYENDMSGLRFGGTLSRKENASAMLNLLKLTGSVDFAVEGRKIIVKSRDKQK
jgi:transmembrane sensor